MGGSTERSNCPGGLGLQFTSSILPKSNTHFLESDIEPHISYINSCSTTGCLVPSKVGMRYVRSWLIISKKNGKYLPLGASLGCGQMWSKETREERNKGRFKLRNRSIFKKKVQDCWFRHGRIMKKQNTMNKMSFDLWWCCPKVGVFATFFIRWDVFDPIDLGGGRNTQLWSFMQVCRKRMNRSFERYLSCEKQMETVCRPGPFDRILNWKASMAFLEASVQLWQSVHEESKVFQRVFRLVKH